MKVKLAISRKYGPLMAVSFYPALTGSNTPPQNSADALSSSSG